MKTTLALLTATLLLLTTPALSLAHDGRGEGPRDRQERSWVQQRSHHDDRRGHHPPKHWQKHHKSPREGYGYYRPQQYHGYPHRDRLILGLPSLMFQFRW